MLNHRVLAAVAVLTLTAGLCAGQAAAAPAGTPGAQGAGDPYFPLQGNGGYTVSHYDLAISYQPGSKALSGTASITAHTTQALSRFDLDLRRSMVATQVLVNGRPATFRQPSSLHQELVVTPRATLGSGALFTVLVTYSGTATPVTDPDGSLDGFIPTDDGAFVASEPQGSPSWFPCNDTPADKATVSLSITVPAGVTAVSNGTLLGAWTSGGQAHTQWSMGVPIPTYLVTATLGTFTVSTGTTPGGIPWYDAVDPREAAASAPVLAKLPAIVDYFATVYGRYPFDSAGAIVDDAPTVGYALETATRPVFDRAPDVLTLAHEQAHQWFGDSVSLTRWRDIWLNEGFAQFSTWLWDEHTGGRTTHQHLQDLLAQPASSSVWNPPPANPGAPDQIFASSVYSRGAGALAALRDKVGDTAFFAVMRGWATDHRQGSATLDEFRAYAEKVTGVALARFFAVWLDNPGKPAVG